MNKWKGPVFLFLAFSLAGTSVISARLVSGRLGLFTIAATSLLLACLFLFPVCGKRLLETLRLLSARDILYLGFQAVFGIFLFRIFLLNGLLLTSAVEAGILTGATPAITAVLALALLREPVSAKALAGIIATVTGIMVLQGLLTSIGGIFSLKHLYGNLLVLCAAASESAFNVISRAFAAKAGTNKKQAIPPLVQTALVSAIAFFLCLIPALFEAPVQKLGEIGLKGWIALLWYGFFVTALAFLFWYSGIKECGALTAAAFSGMMPFTAMVLSVIVLGEHASWQQWLGGMLVLSGMLLIGAAKTPAGTKNPAGVMDRAPDTNL